MLQLLQTARDFHAKSDEGRGNRGQAGGCARRWALWPPPRGGFSTPGSLPNEAVATYRIGMAEAGGETDTGSFQRLNIVLIEVAPARPICSTGSECATSMYSVSRTACPARRKRLSTPTR